MTDCLLRWHRSKQYREEYYKMNMKTWRLVRSQTYQCYSATCTPAQLSLLSDAIAKYSALKEREWLKGEKGKNRQSRSENQNQNKVSVQWGKKGKTFVILKKEQILTDWESGWWEIRTFGRPSRMWKWRTGTGERLSLSGWLCLCVLSVTHALSLRASSPAAAIFL